VIKVPRSDDQLAVGVRSGRDGEFPALRKGGSFQAKAESPQIVGLSLGLRIPAADTHGPAKAFLCHSAAIVGHRHPGFTSSPFDLHVHVDWLGVNPGGDTVVDQISDRCVEAVAK
jgi:hypothetical protein